MTRWEALVRYDDEIRAAAEALFPYGAAWVDKLGEAFFALNEDRKYLPNIVAQLIREAEHSAVVGWLATFSKTVDGKKTSQEALEVLADAQARGYSLEVDGTGAFLVTKKGSGTSFLRSDADILRFGKILAGRAAPDAGEAGDLQDI